MINYNNNFIKNVDILTYDEKEYLKGLSSRIKFYQYIQDSLKLDEIALDFIYNSAKIEYNTYERDEVKDLIKCNTTANRYYKEAKMIFNIKNAFDLALKSYISINPQNISDLQFILAHDLSDNIQKEDKIGDKGNINSFKCNYLPNNYGTIYEDFKNMIDIYDSIENPFEKAIYIHNNICYIQYYKDCNKRLARLLQFISLKNDNIFPLILKNANENTYRDYRNSVMCYYDTGSHRDYADFFIRNYKNMINIIEGGKYKKLTDFFKKLFKSK